MTDTAAAAEWRWTQADEQARLVLESDPRHRASIPLALGVLAAAELVLVVVALSFDPESVGRWVTAMVGAVVGLAVVIVEVIRTVVDGARYPERQAVIKGLLTREQSAVSRAIRRRSPVPDDRLDVVRAAAVQQARGRTLPAACAPFLLWTALAVSGADLWPMYTAVAALWGVAGIHAFREVLLARRYLDSEST